MLLSPRNRAALLVPLLTAPWLGCSAKAPGAPAVSTGKARPGPSSADGGPGGLLVRSARPDGGAILPAADEEVVLPFHGPVISRRIAIKADPGMLDVHFSVDGTSSMTDEINELQMALDHKVVPQLEARVSDVSFGVSRFEDFPEPPFGSPGVDQPFVLLTPITSELSVVSSAVARLDQPLGNGGDVPEAGAEALWQIATGKGYQLASKQLIAPFNGNAAVGGGKIGGVGFRDGALRVVLHITDAPSHAPADYGGAFPLTHSLSDAGKALQALGIKLIAIVSSAQARSDLEPVALLTGAVGMPPSTSTGTCPNGVGGKPLPSVDGHCPLVFDVDPAGSGLSDALVDAIVGLVDGTRFQSVSAEPTEDPIGFVKDVVPVDVTQTETGEPPPAIADLLPVSKPDGKPDSFVQVRSRADLAFDVELRNDRIAPSDVDQVFRAVVRIAGDGVVLQERTLRVRVPAGSRLVPATDENDAGH
jgi:hypothetical protein